jgi:hypothetical protein
MSQAFGEVTGRQPLIHLPQQGIGLVADLFRVRTSRVEPASRRRACGVRHIAGHGRSLSHRFGFRIGYRNGVLQRAGVRMERRVGNLLPGAE